MNSSRVNKASTCLCQGCQGQPGPHCPLCSCQSPQVLGWVLLLLLLAGWAVAAFLLGKRNIPLRKKKAQPPPLLSPCPHPWCIPFSGALFTIPTCLVLLLFILVPGICDFTGDAVEPYANLGKTLSHCVFLRVWTSLGTSGIDAFWKSRCHMKLSSR